MIAATRTPLLRAYAALTLTMLFWAGNAIAGRAVRGDVGPFALAFGRWIIALALVAPLALRRVRADRHLIRAHWRILLFLGLVGVGAFNAFLYSGLRFTTASNALLLQASIPPLVLLIGFAAFRERVSAGQAAGVLLSTLGVAVIVFRGDLHAVFGLSLGRGDALVMAGCLAWAAYTACLRLRPAIHPWSFVFVTFAIGAVAMAPLAAVEVLSAPPRWSASALATFAYVGVFPSLCAYFLYNGAVARLGAGPAGQAISLMPVFGALLATQLLGERLQPFHVAGIAAILGGIGLTWLILRRARSPASGGD